MGTLTIRDFQEEIQAGVGNRSDITTQRIVRVLNLAQSRIARSYDFSETGTVAFGQMSFTGNPAYDKYLIPPPRTKTIHSFVILDTSSVPQDYTSSAVIGSLGQSRKVIEKPWRWFDARYPAPEWIPAGWPSLYKRFGDIITMVPPPFLQFTAQISYTQYPTPFTYPVTDPTQTSDFENKDDVLIAYSLAYLFKLLGRLDRSIELEMIAKQQLDEAIEKDDTRPDIEVARDVPAIAGAAQGPYWADPWIKTNP